MGGGQNFKVLMSPGQDIANKHFTLKVFYGTHFISGIYKTLVGLSENVLLTGLS